MRRLLVVFVGGVVAVCALSVGLASASNGSGTPFKATYTDTALGTLATCSGSRVVQKDGTVKDSETCLLSGDTSRVVAGTVVGNPSYCLGGVCGWIWSSDYDGKTAKTITLQFVDNGDGTFTENIVAYY